MQYPTPSQYQEALQFPATAFRDPELRESRTYQTTLGLPHAITGAFAVVFPVTAPSGKYAVRCFVSESRGQRARYRALSKYLAATPHPFFVPFDYQHEGIAVGGSMYPLIKMRWVDGAPLNRFIEDHLEQPQVLQMLADAWIHMLGELERVSIAHGDLQHGNVLVVKRHSPDGELENLNLRLVDFDTVFLPSLRGRVPAEIGHRNYQHPDRTGDQYGPLSDRFPALVIHAGLQAVLAQPDLWHRYDTGENILFRARDFFDPESSELFSDLDDIPDLRKLTEQVKAACYLDPGQTPALQAVVEGTVPVPRVPVRSRIGRTTRAGNLTGAEAAFMPGATVLLFLAAGAGALGMWAVAAATLAALVGPGGLFVYHRWKKHPWNRRRRHLGQDAVYMGRIIACLQDQMAGIDQQQSKLKNSGRAVYDQRLDEIRDRALYDRLKHHFIAELENVEGLNHKVVVQMKVATIRTAYHASPDRVEAVRTLSDQTRAHINMWRAALVSTYRESLPEALPPAEERRLERSVRNRIIELHEERGRLEEKILVQRKERQRITDQLAQLPEMSISRYLKYLLRIGGLPGDRKPQSHDTGPPEHRG